MANPVEEDGGELKHEKRKIRQQKSALLLPSRFPESRSSFSSYWAINAEFLQPQDRQCSLSFLLPLPFPSFQIKEVCKSM